MGLLHRGVTQLCCGTWRKDPWNNHKNPNVSEEDRVLDWIFRTPQVYGTLSKTRYHLSWPFTYQRRRYLIYPLKLLEVCTKKFLTGHPDSESVGVVFRRVSTLEVTRHGTRHNVRTPSEETHSIDEQHLWPFRFWDEIIFIARFRSTSLI